MDLMRRISYAAVLSVLCMIGAVASVLSDFDPLGMVLGLCSIAWALLSLKDLT